MVEIGYFNPFSIKISDICDKAPTQINKCKSIYFAKKAVKLFAKKPSYLETAKS